MRALLALGLLAAWPLPMQAQEEPGEARAATPAAPDVVKLKNGGLVRGTISELVAGQSVSIITALGDVRRFPMAEVDYAGPAAGASAPAASGSSRKISFEANRPEVTFHRRVSSAVSTGVAVSATSYGSVGVAPFKSTGATYVPLCLAPCGLVVQPGTYYLGLSLEDGSPVSDDRPIVIEDNTAKIIAEYESRAALRTAGFVVGSAGAIGMIATLIGVFATDISDNCQPLCAGSEKPLAIGLGVSLGGMLIGYILGAQTDEVSIAVQ